MPDAREDPFLGREIGGCSLYRLIARGNMGALYGALDITSGDARAVKLLHLAQDFDAGDHAEAARRFEHEAAAASRLDHPDIVRIHRTGAQGELAYLVMDLLPGCDLQRYAGPGRLLPPGAVLEIGRRVALALDHAHSRGVVHRDLKPANVMVDWASHRVTLTDFGLARTTDAQRTRTGLVLGSPVYMAPELLAGMEPSAASDLYALGVMVFQLLCGRLPFDATGLGDLLKQVAQVDAPPVRRFQRSVPVEVETLIGAMLEKNPARRPPSGDAVARMLMDLSHASYPASENAPPIQGTIPAGTTPLV